MQNLPFFVYGTLRRGFGNHRTFGGTVTDVVPATLTGASMTTIGFPYVWRTPHGTVTGELMTVDPDHYADTMDRLDSLEGYRGPGVYNHYEREVVEVTRTDTGETVTAYVYLVDAATAARGIPVPSGDFADTRDPGFGRRAATVETEDGLPDGIYCGDDVTVVSDTAADEPGVLCDLIGKTAIVWIHSTGESISVSAANIRTADYTPAAV